MYKNSILLVFLVCTSFLFSLEMLLKSKAEIEGNVVYLGDIVFSHNLDKVLYDELSKIQIRTISEDNAFSNISSKTVMHELKNYTNADIQVNGSLCSVRRKNQLIPSDSIKKSAKEFVMSNLPKEKNVQVTFFSIPKIKKPKNNYEILFDSNSRFNHSGNIILNGQVWSDQKTVSKFRINVRITVERNVVVLNKNKERNEEITNSDVTVKSLPVNNFLSVISEKEEVVGKIASRYISRGTILEKKYLKEKPAVKRGDEVNIEVMVGPIIISYRAISKEDGFIGEQIQCQNPESKERFLAEIIGNKQLQIVMGE